MDGESSNEKGEITVGGSGDMGDGGIMVCGGSEDGRAGVIGARGGGGNGGDRGSGKDSCNGGDGSGDGWSPSLIFHERSLKQRTILLF